MPGAGPRSPTPPEPVGPRVTHRRLLAIVALVALGAAVGIALLWPGRVAPDPSAAPGGAPPQQALQTTELIQATLLAVEAVADPDPTGLTGFLPDAREVEITAAIDDTGETVTFRMTDETGDTFAAGQRVVLQRIATPGQAPVYFVSDFRRGRPMLLLAALFAVVVVALGRLQGVRALLGLAFTFLVIVGFMIPAIIDGASPVAVAVFGSLAIMVASLYLSHGFNAKTSAAVVGTAAALLLTGLLAAFFVEAAALTGFASEEARLLTVEVGGVDLRGLLLAGIVIGGLGVLDDVTMSQASTVFQIARADPSAGFARLFRSGLSVGRDHIAATVNTLFLAYAGAALPLLLLFALGVDDFATIITSEIVAVEVVRTLVGSIGLVAAVPLTTALAAAVVLGEPAVAHPGLASGP